MIQISWHPLGFLVGRGNQLRCILHGHLSATPWVFSGALCSSGCFHHFKSFSGVVAVRVYCQVLIGQIINKTWTKGSHGKWSPQHNWNNPIITRPWKKATLLCRWLAEQSLPPETSSRGKQAAAVAQCWQLFMCLLWSRKPVSLFWLTQSELFQ